MKCGMLVRMRSVDRALTSPSSHLSGDSRSSVGLQVSVNHSLHSAVMSPNLMASLHSNT